MREPDPEAAHFAAARDDVLRRMAAACRAVGRDPGSVQLVAVSKTVAPDRLRAAVAAGLVDLGENRVQEALAKAPEVPGAYWELVGPLQSNKARKAIETFGRIQTVDTVALAERLDRLAREVRPGSRGIRSCSRSTSTSTRRNRASRRQPWRTRFRPCSASTRSTSRA